eukprot:gnl/Hemi2/7473_TR2562_c0_g1_i1.p2 gnl/Hemi2/7473_TR2562_c0_g1~~gnl/Hemi2/7473_TR2562_c0_g1_i1.p2  ORF type:complete len:128 (+),score=24.58 gnl/Hemi2/7473_TR2562_c0_g1_i1:123-506(+)
MSGARRCALSAGLRGLAAARSGSGSEREGEDPKGKSSGFSEGYVDDFDDIGGLSGGPGSEYKGKDKDSVCVTAPCVTHAKMEPENAGATLANAVTSLDSLPLLCSARTTFCTRGQSSSGQGERRGCY